MSNNVWVEATLHPESAEAIAEINWPDMRLDKLHVTLAFTKLNADDMDFNALLDTQATLTGALAQSINPTNAKVGGFAVFNPSREAFGVLLVNDVTLHDYHTALGVAFGDEMSKSIPGFTPHVTIGAGFSNYHDIEALAKLSRKIESVKFDAVWLRAGRVCLPL